MESPLPEEVPVLIAGGGPAGLAAAVTLALNGVSPLVVERQPGPGTHPRAVGIMQRTMELFRSWGVEDALRTRGLGEEWTRLMLWKSSLFGPVLSTVPLQYGADSLERRFSPVLPFRCSQTDTEELLAQRLESFAGARLAYNTELDAFNMDDDGVTVTVHDTVTEKASRVRCAYLIAADGAASGVRKALDIAVDGPEDMGHFVNVYHEADYGSVLGEQKAMLYQILGRNGGGTFAPVDGRFRWLFHTPLGENERRKDYDEAHCLERIHQCLGGQNIDIRILSIRFWVMAAQVARQWGIDRVLLTGDAAHRTTPVGGTGMNTAIASAHNLAWKVAAVVQGWAGTELLDTYETERRPVVERNVGLSRAGGEAVLRAMEAAAHDDEEGVRSFLQEESTQHSRVGMDLGYTYASAAILEDDTEPVRVAEPITDYVPSGRPGGRAPHLWIWHQGLRISILDLFAYGLTLLTGPEGAPWKEAATTLAETAGCPLHAYLVGPDGDLVEHGGDWCRLYGVEPAGAVLVRPDGFVAWRHAGAADDPSEALGQVLERLFGLKLPEPETASIG